MEKFKITLLRSLAALLLCAVVLAGFNCFVQAQATAFTGSETVACNVQTGKEYATVYEAVLDAASGQTIQLTKDTRDYIVYVLDGVTLDLNGHTLETDYLFCTHHVVDDSQDNTGKLKAAHMILQENNRQLPVKDKDGAYHFYEILGFNTADIPVDTPDAVKYAFQPLFEKAAHELLLEGQNTTGATIRVRVAWSRPDGMSAFQDFTYNDTITANVLKSYNPATGGYGRMFTLVLRGTSKYENLRYQVYVVSATGAAFTVPQQSADGPHTTDEVILSTNTGATAVVPAGTKLDSDAQELSLNVTELDHSNSNITLEGNEVQKSVDVHIDGIAPDNTVPTLITLEKLAVNGLNNGNLKLYHVEDGFPSEMVQMGTMDAVGAHNTFYYDPVTGNVTMALATFSEIAVVSDTENPWNGTVASGFAGGSGTEEDPYTIANADQLAYLNRLVSDDNAEYNSKHYKLIADINFGGSTYKKIWYPIGYWHEGEGPNKAGETWYTYGGAFQGTFDGAGHTITGIYQNTWAMDGSYSEGYWKEAMGLFGYVYGGTVKNLTIDNFYSEGEFTPTGCVAAYASNATFENIAVTNSHPQTYNTSVAAVVGRAGQNGCALTFRNITVDSSNTVSALWGSWDVGAAGLLGYLSPDSEVLMENCNVAATIDVYNDVCGNYQYYWYRYCGMLIGTVDKTKDDGSLDLSNITAVNCTVNFGDRHEYFYCEFVDNSIASYTHDYQFSRIDHKDLTFTDANSNGRVDAAEIASVTGCTHDHVEKGTEVINEETVLKEDKQAVYIPFYQLFGGYGWGVDGIDLEEYNDLQIEVDRRITTGQEESVDKFLANETIKNLESGKTYKLGELFRSVEGADIHSSAVTVGITDLNPDNDSSVTMVYQANTDDWTQGTVTFTGSETIDIIIQDYSFCNPATLSNIQIVEPNILIKNEEFLYGSYFDHDRFDGNTGTRITSGSYNAIKSADALHPAQDITIKVTDTDLSNYKVTLGYFTKDGIYTGRTGILPMVNGELTIKASEMNGAYFRVNVYIYTGQFPKVPESATIVVYGGDSTLPEQPDQPDNPDQIEPSGKPWEGKKISIVGDSISTGGYPGILANLSGATIQNLSVSGKLLAGGLTGMVTGIDADADLVIIFGGTNDYWHKNVDIGTAESTGTNTFNGALRYILNYLKEHSPNAEYLFVFPPDQTFGGYPSTHDFGRGTLDDFREAFLNFCAENNVSYVNLADTEFDSSKHSGDGVHPNSTGHQIIAEAIYQAISQMD